MKNNVMAVDDETFPLEMALLLSCSEYNLTQNQEKKVKTLLLCPIDWDKFFKLASKNRVYPIVYKNLKKIEPQMIDQEIAYKFENLCKKNQIKAIELLSELIKMIGIFKDYTIDALSIKGPLLGLSLYNDVSMRTSKDLDVLIDFKNIKQAGRLLEKEGYTKEINSFYETPKQEKMMYKTNHHICYTNQAGVMIELHWRYGAGKYDLSFKEIWKGKREVEVSGSKIMTLNPEENFLYLIFHGSKHGWKRLRWLCDVNEILQNHSLDWDEIIKKSQKREIDYMLEQALLLVKILFETELPTKLQAFIKEKHRNKGMQLAEMCLPFITSEEEGLEFPTNTLSQKYKKYRLAWHRGIYQKVCYMAKKFYPCTIEFKAYKIKDKYFFLYYIIRPIEKINRMVKFHYKKAGDDN
jgi:hypothetical protein